LDGSGSTWLGLLAVIGLVLLNGFFVAAEFSLVSVRRTRIEQLANEGNRAARGVQKALTHLDTYIAATQLGITMASLALGFVGEPALAHLVEGPLTRILPADTATKTAHGIAIGIAFGIVTALHIVLGELAPKSIALQRPDGTALWVTAPLDIFLRVFKPFILLLNATGNLVVRLLGLRAVTEHASVHSVEELELLVHSTREAGLMQEAQEQMVTGVFSLDDTPVRKIMTPRLDVEAVAVDTPVERLVAVMAESGRMRLPVYDDNLDNIVGVVHIKDVFKALAIPPLPASIREFMVPPHFVPETKRAGFLLGELRRNERQLAVVRDEYGTMSGIVTIEDLLEEIVGEIEDQDDPGEEPAIRQIDARTYLADGRVPLEDFNEQVGANLPTEEADTLGGFVFGLVGHQPKAGETADWDGLQFRVEETDNKRILKVRVVRRDRP
jgi:putative hemolysin